MATPEDRLLALEQALGAQQQLNAQLQQQIAAGATQAHQGGGPPPAAAVAAKVIGKPDRFDGSASAWRDWSIVFRS